MEKLTIEEIQAEELALLEVIDKFCRDNNLEYFLAYGSLLGAVRGAGPIPWDDDIDIVLPRRSYDALVHSFVDTDCVKLVRPGDDNPWLFAKLTSLRTVFREQRLVMPADYGVYIDIFPLDGLPNGGLAEAQREIANLKRVYGYAYSIDWTQALNKTRGSSMKRIIGWLVRQRFDRLSLTQRIEDVCRSNDLAVSEKAACVFSVYPPGKEEMQSSDLEGYSEVMFSGLKIRTFKDPEKYLERVYGSSWRKPIRQDERIHGEAYWRESAKGD